MNADIAPWEPPADMPGRDRAPDLHVSIKFEAELLGAHVHIKVRAAHRIPSVQVDHSRGLCGELTMAPEEWLLLRAALLAMPLPEPLWLTVRNMARKVGPACPEFSDHEGQQFIEIEGWPE